MDMRKSWQQEAREALDSAIAEVAKENAARLYKEIPSQRWEESVDSALESLTRLQGCAEPDYDLEWVNVFYLSWYQPRQIHLAYVALRQLLDRRHPPRYVVDYGCGAWAVQFALAMLLAEKPEMQGAGIAVHGIDSSESMKRIGRELWNKFLLKIVEERHLLKLHDVMKSMEDSWVYHATIEDALAAVQGGRTDGAPGDGWFTAIHAVYEYESKGRPRSNLEDILDTEKYRSLGFATELVTFFSRPHIELRLLKRGFKNLNVETHWLGDLQKTTEWRRTVAAASYLHKHALLDRNPTTWIWRNINFMFRTGARTRNDRF